MDKKYIIDRDSGGIPQNLTITDIIIAKNFKNNKYRKQFRLGIMLYLYRNSIHPKDYLLGLEIDTIKLIAFYFNIVILEKHTKKTMIETIYPIISAKLKTLHKKLSIFWEDFDDGLSIVEWIRCKL